MLATMTVAELVDALGVASARKAEAEKAHKRLRDMLADKGEGAYEGDLFRATVSIADREKIDWQAIAEKLEPSRQLVTAHTSYGSVTTVRSTARNGKE